MAGDVVGDLLRVAFEKLFEKLASSPFLHPFASKKEVWSQLQKWEKDTLPHIYALLEDAEEKQTTSRVVGFWLNALRDLVYDVEDVLDEFATETLRIKLKKRQLSAAAGDDGAATGSCNQVRKWLLSKNFAGYKFTAEMSSKFKKITERLETIKDIYDRYNLGEISVGGVRSYRGATRLVRDSHVFGRDEDKQALLDLLLATEPSDAASTSRGGGVVSVILIHGMGGLGKTALANQLYRDERVEVHFDLRAWVCVSDTDDIREIAATIILSFGGETRAGMPLDQLQGELGSILSGKKFLVVLDDVWNENNQDWMILRKPFEGGALGSKIIVTTRNGEVAELMGTHHHFHSLGELSFGDCLSLFCQHALGANNFDGHPNLKDIGEKIVRRCKGLPLAAKTLGSLLHTKLRSEYWQKILECQIWDFPEESDILPSLRLSYQHLSSQLKQCFVYCAIFPKGYEFTMNELILLWMAKGFLSRSEGNKHLKDVGVDFFHALLSRSFFQPSNKESGTYVMHDLIHDLAQYVAGYLCFNVNVNLEKFEHSSTVQRPRHSYLIQPSHDAGNHNPSSQSSGEGLKSAIHEICSDQLRTLFLSGDIDDNMLLRCKNLRVLSLYKASIKVLPKSVGKMKLLRYLDISGTAIQVLPDFVTELYNLQTLKIQDCHFLENFPKKITNLIDFRHILMDSSTQLPGGVGQLTCLQTLPFFVVGENKGHHIEELGSLTQLRGRLCISNLGNVKDKDEAKKAGLLEKSKLCELALKWGSSEEENSSNNGEGALEGLQPHSGLKDLMIVGFGGMKFASWLLLLENLMKIELKNCNKCVQLPALGHLPTLKVVIIDGLENVISIGSEFYYKDGDGSSSIRSGGATRGSFPSLRELTLRSMPSLGEWMEEPSENMAFPCLEQLTIQDCPQLANAPSHFPSLRSLIVNNVLSSTPLEKICSNLTSLVSLQIEKVSALTILPHGISQNWKNLTDLKIKDCHELASIEPVDQQSLAWGLHSSFKTIEIVWCTKLRHLPSELETTVSLRNLTIRFCTNLISLPSIQGLTSLVELSITDCYKIVDLPIGLQSSRSLKKLVVAWCPDLKVPALNFEECTSLQSLCINCCGNLTSFPEGLQSLPRLKSLGVGGFLMSKRPDYFPSEGLQNLVSIRELVLYGWARVKSLPTELQHLTALQSLTLNRFKRIEILPEELGSLSSLESLSLVSCEDLKFFPPVESMRRLSQLKSLRIIKCPLLKERCIAGTGSQWPKISHIPSIVTD